MLFFPGQHDLSGSGLVSWWNIYQPRKGCQSKRLASVIECQGITFIPRFGILVLTVYPKLCSCGQVSQSFDWSEKCQEK